MADTIPMSDPPQGGDAGVSDSTRKCALCGEAYSGISHAGCPGDRTIKDPRGPTTRAQIDAIPEEAAQAAADPDRALNQYILVRQIGKGGMGTVWKAWDRNLTRWVAIKFLLASDEDGVARFRREAKLAARLRHPNIAAIYEVGTAPSKQRGTSVDHYLAMEYIDGQTLAAAKLTVAETLEIFLRVAKAMDAAHRGGVIHRDLKPANIMITQDKWPYVMDFGLAKALETESSLSVSGAIMGTPAFMPPEQAEGKADEIDAQSDVYSLGATLYSVLLGRAPFSGQNVMSILRKVAIEQPPAPRSLKPDLAPEIESLILKALSKNKKDRQASAAAFAEELSRCLSGTRVAEIAGTSAGRESGKPSKSGLFVGALAASALVAAAVYFGIGKPQPPPPAPSRPQPETPVAVPEPSPIRRPVAFPSTPEETFHLRVAVYPFAEIAQILRDGEPVKLAEKAGPFLESNLPVGNYELTLRHPKLGERKVTIAKSAIKGGRTYLISGRMENAALQVSESP